MILTLSIAGLITGIITGLIICIFRYPAWEFRKMKKVYHSMVSGNKNWVHVEQFVDHTNNEIVKPNCDTLYSFVFFDLKKGNYKIQIPKSNNRYFSISFLADNTNVLHHINRRNYGTKTEFVLSNKKDKNAIYLNTNICWAIARFGVKSNDEIPIVNNLQHQLKLHLVDESN